jgi:hypothetical protein
LLGKKSLGTFGLYDGVLEAGFFFALPEIAILIWMAMKRRGRLVEDCCGEWVFRSFPFGYAQGQDDSGKQKQRQKQEQKQRQMRGSSLRSE